MVLRFKDNNRLNCKLENLEIVGRQVHLRLNLKGYDKLPVSLKTSVKALVKLEVKTFALMKKYVKAANRKKEASGFC